MIEINLDARKKMANGVIEVLEAIVTEGGLASVYTGIEDWLYDLWPDFSWDELHRPIEITIVLVDSRFEAIKVGFLKLFDFDIEAELVRCLNPIK